MINYSFDVITNDEGKFIRLGFVSETSDLVNQAISLVEPVASEWRKEYSPRGYSLIALMPHAQDLEIKIMQFLGKCNEVKQ